MDSLAHGLWSAVLGRGFHSGARWWVLALVGAGPDLVWLPFTFTNLLTSGRVHYFQGPYNVSHSFVVWLIGTLLLTWFWKKTAWQWTWPWALHIIVDAPGHQGLLTPIFWPVSNWKLHGAWEWLTLENIFLTYLFLGIVFIFLWWRDKKSLHS